MLATPLRRALDSLPTGISRVWLRRLLLGNLAAQIGIVLTGGVVRLTGSGLGCPTFPECVPGSYLPVVTQPQGMHKYIEFGNRMLTFVVSVLAVAALLAVVRLVRSGVGGRRLLALGAVPFVGVMAQALIGGVTVLTGLNPTVVAVHFLVSMALIAASTLLLLVAVPPVGEAARATGQDGPATATGRHEPATATKRHEPATASGGDEPAGTTGQDGTGGRRDRPRSAVTRTLVVAMSVAAVAVLALGTVVTGSGPHSGDAAEPNRFDVDIQVVARLHSGAVWLFVALLLGLLLALHRGGGPADARRRAGLLLLLTVAQGILGYVQYALGVPAVLVAAHMLAAALFVVAVTATAHAVLRRRPGTTSGPLAHPSPDEGLVRT